MADQLPEGLKLLQINPDIAVDLTGSRYHGWLFYLHPDGQWVTLRKLADWEIMQAEDQVDAEIVINKQQPSPFLFYQGKP